MHSFMAVAIAARFIILSAHSKGAIASAPGAETKNLGHADATFLHTEHEDELLAAFVSAHISEPDRVTGVLNELRVESTSHLGRLDLEEWSEMMTEMRIGGVALGSRNKLRLLVAARSASAGAWQTPWVDGPRRVQELQAEKSSAAEQASQQESTNEPAGTGFGVSGDGAPRPPQSDYCEAHLCIVASLRARHVADIGRGVCAQ
jgi:hypothetical protein